MNAATINLIRNLLTIDNEDDFLARYTKPFFVLIKRDLEKEDNQDDDDLDFYTVQCSLSDAKEAGAILSGGSFDHNAQIFELSKRHGSNPFSALITIGRAENCDIVYPSQAISKFHAYVSIVPKIDNSTEYRIADGGSRNGTKHNDVPLIPKKVVVLNDGDRVDIADVVSFQYFTPTGLWQQLEKIRFRS